MRRIQKILAHKAYAIPLSAAIFLFIPTSAVAAELCESIGYGIIGEADFEAGKNSTINGETIKCPDGGDDCDANTPTPTGELDQIDVDFPPLDPASFPSTGGTDLTDAQNIQPGSYGTLTAENKGSLTFSGGGDYFISEIDLSNKGTFATFGPGRYYINDFDMVNGTSIKTTGKVELFIGDELDGGNQLGFNVDGPTTDLIISLYQDAEFEVGNADQGSSDVDFNGILYSPYPDTEIEFGNNNDITGAIFSAGEVEVGNNTDFQYDEDLASDVGESLGCDPTGTLNHIRITHDGQTSACTPQSLIISTCANDDCSELFEGGANGTVSAGANQLNWSLPEGQGSLAVEMYIPFDGSAAPDIQTSRLSASSQATVFCEQAISGAVNSDNACDVQVSRAGFTLNVPDFVSAVPENGARLEARRMDTKSACVPLFKNVPRTVEFQSDYEDPDTGTRTLTLGGTTLPDTATLSFNDNGEALLPTLDYTDAGRLRLSARYDGSDATGDTGTVLTGDVTFVVRPARFEISDVLCASGAGVTTANGEPGNLAVFCRAGEPFSLSVSAVNAQGAITPNYGREASPESATLTRTLTQPTLGAAGILDQNTPLAFNANDGTASGVAQAASLTWSDVGIIEIEASNNNYLNSGEEVTSTPSEIGRFIPAYFAASPSTPELLSPACPNFSYLGQPMSFDLAPQLELTARSLTNQNVSNYFDDFFRHPAPSLSDLTYESNGAPAATSIEAKEPRGSITLDADSDDVAPYYQSHLITVDGEELRFIRSDVLAPFDDATVDLVIAQSALTDADNVCVRSSAADSTCDTVRFPDIPTPEQRYGRLFIENVYGPENVALPISMEAEYWNGTSWTPNTDDSCTTITDSIQIIADEDSVEPELAGTGGDLSAGELIDQLRWQPPGKQGEIQFEYTDTDDWLTFDWSDDGTEENPDAYATFGVYRGNDRVISWEEL